MPHRTQWDRISALYDTVYNEVYISYMCLCRAYLIAWHGDQKFTSTESGVFNGAREMLANILTGK